MKTQSLQARITAYAAQHPQASTAEIAATMGTSTAYVRVCLRQRLHGRSEIDKRYEASPKGKLKDRLDYLVKVWREKVVMGRTNLSFAYRRVYRQALDAGASRERAHQAASRVRDGVIRDLGAAQ